MNGDEVTLFLTIAKPATTSANITLRMTGDAFSGEARVRFMPAAKSNGTRLAAAVPPAPTPQQPWPGIGA